jgi:hypothetical protein
VGEVAGWKDEAVANSQTVNNTQINVFGATAKSSQQWSQAFTKFLESGKTEDGDPGQDNHNTTPPVATGNDGAGQ